jgi:hypothetical protein
MGVLRTVGGKYYKEEEEEEEEFTEYNIIRYNRFTLGVDTYIHAKFQCFI